MSLLDDADVLEVQPAPAPPDAAVSLPGSKSYTNRALAVAALADGLSVLEDALFSDDTRIMAGALRRLGVPVYSEEPQNILRVDGLGGKIPAKEAEILVGNAGTAARFLLAILALGEGSYRLDGSPRMRERPIHPLVDALNALGSHIRCEKDNGCPPVAVEARGLRGGRARMRGDMSSQYFSALLMVGPYMETGLDLEVDGPLVSRPYVDMTVQLMGAFGVKVERDGYRRFIVAPGQRYRGRHYRVEPDASAASYFFAAAAILGGRVRVDGLGQDSVQGDVRFLDLLERMGCHVTRGPSFLQVEGPPSLRGIEADLQEMPDVAQTLAVLAPFADRPTVMRGISHLRLKETDRVFALARELRRLGVPVDETSDALVVYPSRIRAGTVDTYSDHRMAMSFGLIGLRVPGIRIRDPGCVNKSFPGYFQAIQALVDRGKGTKGRVLSSG